jgi:hypothetical protein
MTTRLRRFSKALRCTGHERITGEPDSVAAYSLADVFEWLRETPEQIERGIIDQNESPRL